MLALFAGEPAVRRGAQQVDVTLRDRRCISRPGLARLPPDWCNRPTPAAQLLALAVGEQFFGSLSLPRQGARDISATHVAAPPPCSRARPCVLHPENPR